MLFHVTADTTWSNLPLSGLFVDMLRRIVALSGENAAPPDAAAAGADKDPATTGSAAPVPTLPPSRILDGFGVARSPSGHGKAGAGQLRGRGFGRPSAWLLWSGRRFAGRQRAGSACDACGRRPVRAGFVAGAAQSLEPDRSKSRSSGSGLPGICGRRDGDLHHGRWAGAPWMATCRHGDACGGCAGRVTLLSLQRNDPKRSSGRYRPSRYGRFASRSRVQTRHGSGPENPPRLRADRRRRRR